MNKSAMIKKERVWIPFERSIKSPYMNALDVVTERVNGQYTVGIYLTGVPVYMFNDSFDSYERALEEHENFVSQLRSGRIYPDKIDNEIVLVFEPEIVA